MTGGVSLDERGAVRDLVAELAANLRLDLRVELQCGVEVLDFRLNVGDRVVAAVLALDASSAGGAVGA